MTEKLLHPSTEEFDKLLKSEKLLLVDFWAAWCGPCKMLSPVIDSLADQYDSKVTVAKINVDENQELSARYGIQTIPTVILFKDGEQIAKEIGVQPVATFTKLIEAAI